MKRIWLSLIAAAVLAVAAFAPAAAQDTVTIDMNEVDDSGQSGSANITTDGEQVTVAIEIDAGEEGVPQPAHIHEGSCDDLGDVAYPLDSVEDGESESTADVGMDELLPGEYAINVHLSEDQMDVHVACGNLPLIGGAPDDEGEGEEEEADDEEAEDDESADDEDEEEADDEEAEDDETAEDEGDDTDDAEDAADDEDDAQEVAPAAGSIAGPDAGASVTIMLLLSGAALAGGLLLRRQVVRA